MKPTPGEPPILAETTGTGLPNVALGAAAEALYSSEQPSLEPVDVIPVARLLSIGQAGLSGSPNQVNDDQATLDQASGIRHSNSASNTATRPATIPPASTTSDIAPEELARAEFAVPPILSPEALLSPQTTLSPEPVSVSKPDRTWRWWLWLPMRFGYFLFQLASLVLLLAVVSSLPILQLAGLGYMLEVGRRIADRSRRESILPGLSQATRIGVIAAGAYLTWLPVWLISDYAYSANLIEVDSRLAQNWRIAAWVFSVLWVTHVAWAMLRGGQWFHFLWPAPIRFAREIFRPSTWRRAEDGLWQYTVGLKLPSLMWLGLRGAVGGLAWLTIPAVLMLIGVTANNQPGRIILGLIGFGMMTVVLMYLPFLQVQMARENRFASIFDVQSIRRDFKRAPWAFFLAFFLTLAVALPLYLFRIESLPQELVWIPCLFFVALTLPARMLVGWALQRGHRDIPKRIWISRWAAWTLQLASVPFYVLFLYLAMLTSWDGALIFFVQHAFLVPVPFSGT